MNAFLCTLALAASSAFLAAAPAHAGDHRGGPPAHGSPVELAHQHVHRQAIERVLQRYEQALNQGDANAAADLYTWDGVLMAPDSPTAVGQSAVRDAYAGTFQAIGLDIRFQVAEIRFLSEHWALLRSTSTGKILLKANGTTIPEFNQELFLLQRERGQWKLARYSFSTTK